jgi:hypothetical protein
MPSRSHVRIREALANAGWTSESEAASYAKAQISAGESAARVARRLGLTVEETRHLAAKVISASIERERAQ